MVSHEEDGRVPCPSCKIVGSVALGSELSPRWPWELRRCPPHRRKLTITDTGLLSLSIVPRIFRGSSSGTAAGITGIIGTTAIVADANRLRSHANPRPSAGGFVFRGPRQDLVICRCRGARV